MFVETTFEEKRFCEKWSKPLNNAFWSSFTESFKENPKSFFSCAILLKEADMCVRCEMLVEETANLLYSAKRLG